MRELKFRAWDKRHKQYVKPYAVCLDGRVIVITEPSNDLETLDSECVIIEFGTGLKDENGKEIYEGDIIQVHTLADNEITNLYRVYWNRQFLTYGLKCLCGNAINDELWQVNMSVEIIGNIHENADIIKV